MGSQVLTYLIMRFLLLAAVAVCGVWAQDTYKCPDGWLLEEDRSGCRCFLVADGEAVTKDDANILCAFHQGWVAELDHPGIEYWLKSVLLDTTEVGEYAAFWLGATTTGRHDPDHNQGEWWWPHKNQSVSWFDWADGEPNDYHNEDCLSGSTTTLSSPGHVTTSGMTMAAI